MNYLDFLEAKHPKPVYSGFDIPPKRLHTTLFLWQRAIVAWALKLGRRFVGIELKESYFKIATRNLKAAEFETQQPTLFDLLPVAA